MTETPSASNEFARKRKITSIERSTQATHYWLRLLTNPT
jgi:hypothetical protein